MSAAEPFLVGLRLAGRRACAVGDLHDLVRRVRDLRRTGAALVVVCDDTAVSDDIASFGFDVRRRAWRPNDFAGCRLAVVCLAEGFADAAAAAREAGCLVYVPDVPEVSDVVMTARVRRGPLQVGVSTGGHSPAAARRMAERIDAGLPPTTAATVDAMAAARHRLRETGLVLPRYETWAAALDAGLEADDDAAAAAAVRGVLGAPG